MVKKLTMWSFLEPFLYSQEYLHLADISKRLVKPHTTVRQYLNYFEKQGILIKIMKGRLTLYKLNFNNPLILQYIFLIEKETLLNKCERSLILRELVSFLTGNLNENNKALIFGSAAENLKKANDIDLLIIGNINFQNKVKDFENNFNVKIHLINVEDLKKITNTLKQEIKKKHLIIKGTEEIIRWLT